MRRYILRRLVISIPVLLGITVITFTVSRLVPGDFVDAMLPPEVAVGRSAEDLDALREHYGLNKPLYLQYLVWLREVARGNLGYAFMSGESVLKEIMERLPATLELTITSLLFGIVVGTGLGILSAVYHYSWFDQLVTVLGFVWVSTPNFVFAIGAIYIFALKVPIFPTSGIENYGAEGGLWVRLHHLVLPSLVLSLRSVAGFMRYARASLLEVIRQDYVTVARAKGLGERVILLRHALRNALIPLVTIVGLSIPYLLGGSVIIESIFAWPGVGSYNLQGITTRDYPVIMGVNFIVAVLVLLSNLLTDIAYAVVDPRVRYE